VRGAARARYWPRRLMTGAIVLLVLAIVVTGSGYLYLRYQLGRIGRLEIPGLGDNTGGVMNVLLVGSDSRDRLTGDLAAQAGKDEVSGKRSDTIMVLHVDPKQTKAAILSIPRDLYVPIDGTGESDRINAAFSDAGAPGLVRTVESALDIPIHHYVEIDFVGFKEIVDAVGGVDVYFPAPVRDESSDLDIPKAGCIRLDGDQALAFVRARNFETFQRASGQWEPDPTADLGRIQRQQDFIRRMMRKAVSSGLTNPIKLNRLVGIGVNQVTLDTEMSTGDIGRLARRFRSLDPETVDMITLPTQPAMRGGASVLVLQEEEAQRYIDRLNGKAPPDLASLGVQPADVRVRVLNGSGADGVAREASTGLQDAGFNIADRGDADTYDYTRSVIRHAPGQRAKAQLLEGFVQGNTTIEEDRALRTVDLTLILGSSYRGIAAAAPEAPEAPGTTAAPLADAEQPAAPKEDPVPAC
jgi:polyisoprenyl-teichoic acid--peptidoglycan teichoic acid transferase